ncbi:MAG: metallophosphoesterase [Lachnospiraceae bacterium]|nr:metallophosphoesterase [Lachnospiraceae bacterium]
MDGRNKKKKRKNRIETIVFFSVLFVLAVWTLLSFIPLKDEKSLDLIDGEGKNVRVLLITDLHSCYYGKDQKTLIRMIDKAKPDIVMLGGDFFDDKLDDKNAKIVAEYIAERYPCFYVTGNHEYWSERVTEMKSYMKDIGINVLEGSCVTIDVNGCPVDVCGVDDPTRLKNSEWRAQLKNAYSKTDDSHLKLLLSHRPEPVDEYAKFDFDLIMAGHAHAGQFRIPFLNRGMYAPNQGFMARYVDGTYELSNGSLMEVSRGLARESTPLPRFFNNPEIVVLNIH